MFAKNESIFGRLPYYLYENTKIQATISKYYSPAAGPKSSVDYFQIGALLGQKRHFGTSIPGQIRKNCFRAFEDLSYLAYKIQKINYV